MRPNATVFMLAGLFIAYLLNGQASLLVATLSIAIPVVLREVGWLRDHDELQRHGQRRGALWAFLLLLAMAPVFPTLGAGSHAFAGRSLESAIALFALIYLAETRGAGTAVRWLLWLGALLDVAYGLGHWPDLDKLAAMVMVALGFAIVGFLAGRLPRLAAVIVTVIWLLRLGGTIRAGGPDLVLSVPPTFLVLAMVVLLSRVHDQEEATS